MWCFLYVLLTRPADIVLNMLVSFLSLWQNIWKKKTFIKGKRLMLAHTFRDFSPWSPWSVVLGPVTRQKIKTGPHGEPKIFTLLWQECKESLLSYTKPPYPKSIHYIRAFMIPEPPKGPISEDCCFGDQAFNPWAFYRQNQIITLEILLQLSPN